MRAGVRLRLSQRTITEPPTPWSSVTSALRFTPSAYACFSRSAPPAGKGLDITGLEVPVLSEVAATPIGREGEDERPGEGHLTAIGFAEGCPPFHAGTIAANDGVPDENALPALGAGRSLPVASNCLVPDVGRAERGRTVRRLWCEPFHDEGGVTRFPGASVPRCPLAHHLDRKRPHRDHAS